MDGSKLMSLSQQILDCDDSTIEPIDLPEWGVTAFIRTMTGIERDSWDVYATKELAKNTKVNIRGKIVCICLCDEDGKRLFGDGQAEALSKKNAKALNRVYDAALKLNKMRDEDIEDLEKNLKADPKENSGSA
jgi:hypothetical protein